MDAASTEEVPDEFFRLVVDRTAIPFLGITSEGTIRYASPSVGGLVGWQPADLLGRNIFDFIDPAQAALATAGLSEVLGDDASDAGIPIVFSVRRSDGCNTWLEVAAMPFEDRPGLGLTALRLRRYEPEHHLDDFLQRLLADEPLSTSLPALCRSIAASVEGRRAAVFFGFDGARFGGVAGSWDAAVELDLGAGAWVRVLRQDHNVGGLERAETSPGTCATWTDVADPAWLVAVVGKSIPEAVLVVWPDVGDPPLLGHLAVLQRGATYVELALVRTAEHQRLLHLAGHDSLTGVANRASFRDHLSDALAAGEPDIAVAFCDLDGFKEVNDLYGHNAGDDILIQVADRLTGALRHGDELARLGGDEFTVLWRAIPDEHRVSRVAKRLLNAMNEPFKVPGGTVSLSLSIGIALAHAAHSADTLLAAADAALYDAKRRGGATSTIAQG